ncbi:ABC transporter ATP-binding protein, LivG homolog [Candidatus Profftella armatura (Diaphorina cf. continua)]|uniref:ABC transporter ATP-binding protein, LivG homolog n=1 Tax=Candidatus Profftella armatura (Diaphorina cf. continua) TaxID=2661583 RepID=A0A7R6VYV5_9PROT|nr:ATP-binding cassette domain-containing protein [Candidatus Profftella armatura (Diaphorina cf. continua)]BCG49551.1 ABC transporter ATP-binding protein, LivG homolog [Candidatus Profftella armatura (Diaphorina cf. continua)]
MTSILKVFNITKYCNNFLIINNINFSLKKGEILGVTGNNESGKTILTRIISGFLRQDKGNIFLQKKLINSFLPFKRVRIGIIHIFQNTNLFTNLSVLDNVTISILFGSNHNMNLIYSREKAFEYLKFVGLQKFSNSSINKLTQFNKKKLKLAKAFGVEPKIILLDEIMSGLNKIEILKLAKIIEKIRNLDISILFVDKNFNAIKILVDRLLVLYRGKKIADDFPKTILSDKILLNKMI